MAIELLSERIKTFGAGSTRIAELPDLAEIQKSSFKWFIEEGLAERSSGTLVLLRITPVDSSCTF